MNRLTIRGHSITGINLFLILVSYLFVPTSSLFADAATQNPMMTKKWEANEINTNSTDLFDMMYGFFIRTINHDSIAQKLHTIYQEDIAPSTQNKIDYGYLILDAKLENGIDNIEIQSASKNEIKNAAGDETLKSLAILSELSQMLSFSLDFGSLFKPSSSSNYVKSKKPTAVKKSFTSNEFSNRAGLMPISRTNDDGMREIFNGQDNNLQIDNTASEDKNETKEFSWSSFAKFNGSLGHGLKSSNLDNDLGDKINSFSLNMKNEQGTYEFSKALTGQDRGAGMHKFKAPLYQELNIGRELSWDGKTVSTSVSNILCQKEMPRFDLVYFHQDEIVKSYYVITKGRQRIELISTLPSQNAKLTNESFKSQETTKYELKYNFTF